MNKIFDAIRPLFHTGGVVPAPKSDLDLIRENKCPDCQSTQLFGGPSGGMSQNILCGNCGMEWNVHVGFGTGPMAIDRTGQADAGRARVFGFAPEEVTWST